MTAKLVRVATVDGTGFRIHVIETRGDDGPRQWVQVVEGSSFHAFWSGPIDEGAMPAQEVVLTVAIASTSSRPRFLLHRLRFHGWDFWPARPKPLSRFLDFELEKQRAAVAVEALRVR